VGPTAPDPHELLALALRAASAAVELVHRNRPADLGVAAKSTATDLVTRMDTASEALIREILLGGRPQDTVVGEEGDDTVGTSGVTWWVDPIDGTTNYVYDHPGYAVSIAGEHDGRTVAGVVADPTHHRTYGAVRGAGAWCGPGDGTDPAGRQRLRLGAAPPLEQALVATGFSYDAATRARQGAVAAGLLPRVRDLRRMGAAALDLCSVGAGRVDAYYEEGLSPWDMAAGVLVAEEAGARLGAVDGGDVRAGSVLAAHPDLFEPLRDLLAQLRGAPLDGDGPASPRGG
jgi:myo-inositol-1(or 4)-monophosphatase